MHIDDSDRCGRRISRAAYTLHRAFRTRRLARHYFTPNLLAVTLSLPVKSVRELIDHAKKNPGALLFASSGSGSTFHLGGELFKLMTGTQMVHVPFKAVQLAMTDLTAGRVHLMFNSVASIEPHVKAGRLRGLAVTSLKRSVAFPELPTVSEAGLPGFEVVAWAGVIAPAKTPKAIRCPPQCGDQQGARVAGRWGETHGARLRVGGRHAGAIRRTRQERSLEMGRCHQALGRETRLRT